MLSKTNAAARVGSWRRIVDVFEIQVGGTPIRVRPDPPYGLVNDDGYSLQTIQGKRTQGIINSRDVQYLCDDNTFVMQLDSVSEWRKEARLTRPYTLITTHSDSSVTESHAWIADDALLLKWYSNNVECRHPKIKPIPIGVCYSEEFLARGGLSVRQYEGRLARRPDKTVRFFASFRTETNPGQRLGCIDAIDRFAIRNEILSLDEYLNSISKSMFTLSPNGCGIDCHRTWEALAAKSIPIITHNPMVDLGMYDGLPVIIIPSWDQFDASQFTDELYHQMMNNFDPMALTIERFVEGLKPEMPGIPDEVNIDLRGITSILIGASEGRHRYWDRPEFSDRIFPHSCSVPRMPGGPGYGCSAAHANAIQIALRESGPVLLLEDDSATAIGFDPVVKDIPRDADVVWIGRSVTVHEGIPTPQVGPMLKSGYHKLDGFCQGTHAILLMTETGKREWLAAAQQSLGGAYNGWMDLACSDIGSRRCNHYVVNSPLFIQPDHLHTALDLRPAKIKVKVISLPDSKRRRQVESLQSKHLDISVFGAVDGRDVKHDEDYLVWGKLRVIYDRKRCMDQHGRLLLDGEIGCALSHFALYEEFYRSGDPVIMILEDDAHLISDDVTIRNVIDLTYPYDSWDICYVQDGAYTKIGNVNGVDRVRQGVARTHGYMVTRRGVQKLLSGFSLHSAADGFLHRTLGDADVVLRSNALVGLGSESGNSEIHRVSGTMSPTRIPKVIHTCWFSGSPLGELQKMCLESWHRFMPDYEIKVWTQNDWDYSRFRFAREAIQYKQWAFASDVFRLDVLLQHGGIYFDLDIEAVRSMDRFLCHEFFTTMDYPDDHRYLVGPYALGAAAGNNLIGQLLAYYDDNRAFVRPDGSFDRCPNSIIIKDRLVSLGLDPQWPSTEFMPGHMLLPFELMGSSRPLSFAIHHYAGSWLGGPTHVTQTETKPWDLLLDVHPNVDTVRYGPPRDGGYVIPNIPYSLVISIGVGGDIEFEKDFNASNPEVPIKFYDHTINGLPEEIPGSQLFPIGLGCGPKMLPLNDLIAGTGLLLKIDCEGGEWNCQFESADLSQVLAVVVELHDLHDRSRYGNYEAVLGHIAKDFVLINLHPNNWGGTFEYGGKILPRVVEASYVRREVYVRMKSDTPLLAANYPNNPDTPDITVPGQAPEVMPGPVRARPKSCHEIDGWMDDHELDWLRAMAVGKKNILEVGSWKGRSSAAIAEGMDQGVVLTCLDTWRGSDNETLHDFAKGESDPVWNEFLENHFVRIAQGSVRTVRMKSLDGMQLMHEKGEMFDYIFIDADHSFEACRSDIEAATKLLAPGGLLCGHDFDWPGVNQAVCEAGGRPVGAGSIWKIPGV
jgi:hypothetical protein